MINNKEECSICEKVFPKSHMSIECPICYLKGFNNEKAKVLNSFAEKIKVELNDRFGTYSSNFIRLKIDKLLEEELK